MRRMLHHRKGFSLVELTLTSGLLAALAVLLSSLWTSIGRTSAELIGRSRLVQERDMAIAALSRDLGGWQIGTRTPPSTTTPTQIGERVNGRWLYWQISNNGTNPLNQDLTLTYDGGVNASGAVLPQSQVRYLLMPDEDPNRTTMILVRRETPSVNALATYTDFTVAKNVHSMTIQNDPDDSTAVNIVMCFRYRALTLTCDLTAKQPSVPTSDPLPWSIHNYTNP